MKLQLALDDITIDEAVALLDRVHPLIDIVEVGTPFLIEDGLRPVRDFRARYPDLPVLADVTIMDAGHYEARQAFEYVLAHGNKLYAVAQAREALAALGR